MMRTMWTPCPQQLDDPIGMLGVARGVWVRLVVVLVCTGVSVGLLLWRGFVLQCLWGWFMVPLFAVPALTLGHALGVACVGWILTNGGSVDHNAPWSRTIRTAADHRAAAVSALLAALGYPLLALATGWGVKTFL